MLIELMKFSTFPRCAWLFGQGNEKLSVSGVGDCENYSAIKSFSKNTQTHCCRPSDVLQFKDELSGLNNFRAEL